MLLIMSPCAHVCLQLACAAGDVFLQSDVYEAATAMRDAFEQQGSEAFGLHPLHQQAAVFQWTDQDQLAAKQAAAAAAAAAGGGGGGEDPSAASTPHVASDEGEASTDSSRSSAEEEEEEGGSSAGQEVFVSQWAAGGWLVDNPLGVPTEREHYVQQQGGPVYRVLLTKVEQ
jgi:tRNA (guanine-N7-)-methyltransferase